MIRPEYRDRCARSQGNGGTAGAVVNAANEIANEMFRAGNIRFGQIVQKVDAVLTRHKAAGFIADPTLDQLLAADEWARREARR